MKRIEVTELLGELGEDVPADMPTQRLRELAVKKVIGDGRHLFLP